MSSVVIVDIDKSALEKNKTLSVSDEVKARLLSLAEYQNIAERVINYFNFKKDKSDMLNNEDAVSFVVEHLIRGTIRWKPDGGRTLRSYLNQCGLWAIQRWRLNKKQANRYNTISLDTEIDDNGTTMYTFVEDTTLSPHLNIDEIINKPYLNDTQKECLRLRFVEGLTYKSIGEILQKTKQRIEQIVNSALQKLRNEYEAKAKL